MIVPLSALLAAPLWLGLPGLSRGSQPPAQDSEKSEKSDRLSRLRSLYPLPADYVRYARVPEEGLHPRLAFTSGEIGVLYFVGPPEGGELALARTTDEGKSFSASQRIGRTSCSEIGHVGAIDLGPDGTAHVVWTTKEDSTLHYVRVPREGGPSAPLDLGAPPGLCASAAVTLDGRGRILVFYAANDPARQGDPLGRTIWMRASEDGVEFTPPVIVDHKGRGFSEGSTMSAHTDDVMGTIFLLYRSAYLLKPDSPSLGRGMRLIHSTDGQEFDSVWVDNWKSIRDPHAFTLLSQEENTTLAVWEAGGQVFWSVIRRQLKKVEVPMDPRTEGPPVFRSRPSGAAVAGRVLLAWLERPKDAPDEAPHLAWRVWLREERAPIGDGVAPAAPRAGSPAVLPRAGGGFTILY